MREQPSATQVPSPVLNIQCSTQYNTGVQCSAQYPVQRPVRPPEQLLLLAVPW